MLLYYIYEKTVKKKLGGFSHYCASGQALVERLSMQLYSPSNIYCTAVIGSITVVLFSDLILGESTSWMDQ